MRLLPGFIGNVAPHVDGIIALDDGSTDGSREYLGARPEVLEVLSVQRSTRWDEVGNYRLLVSAARRHRAEWLVCLDVDERVEREFRARAERVIRRGRLLRISAYALRLHELWGDTRRFRADGIWGRKAVARLFRLREDHIFDDKPVHGIKAPLQARWCGRYPLADLRIYHLGMLHSSDRAARRRRYERADPEERYQPIGYAYLTDERGLRLEEAPPGRNYIE